LRAAANFWHNTEFVAAFEGALSGLARLDERVKRCQPELSAGFAARGDFFEAQAAVGRGGELIHLEDVVLHDAAMDVRTPTPEVLSASVALHRRRLLVKTSKQKLASPEFLAKITGLPPSEFLDLDVSEKDMNVTDDDEFGGDADQGDFYAIEDDQIDFNQLNASSTVARSSHTMSGLYREIAALPAFLGGLVLLDQWLFNEAERFTDIGPLLCLAHWKSQGLVTAHCPQLGRALWKSRLRWQRNAEFVERITTLARISAELAKIGHAELDRLSLAYDSLQLRVSGRSIHAKVKLLPALFIELPLVSAAIIAKRLDVTQQAVDYMLAQLGPALPRELTGRSKYRAWGIA
jgi:hypothetical protein